MKKVLTLALFGLTAMAPLALVPAAAHAVAAEETVTFEIENMTCALCPVTVKSAMEGVEGVRAVEMDPGARSATVTFDSSVTNAEAIAAASANAGYPAIASD